MKLLSNASYARSIARIEELEGHRRTLLKWKREAMQQALVAGFEFSIKPEVPAQPAKLVMKKLK